MLDYEETYKDISLDNLLEIDFIPNDEISNFVNQLKIRLNKLDYSSLEMIDEDNQISFLTHVLILFSEKYPKISIDRNIILQIKREIYIKYLLLFK